MSEAHDSIAPVFAPVFAPAKINLFLHVTGRRADGLHLLQSLFVYASVGDYLSVETSSDMSLDVSGPFASELASHASGRRDNIVHSAADGLRALAGKKLQVGELPAVQMQLQKNLPVAAGIGGGSADAAAALRLLDEFWGLKVSEADLMALALSLGADVPACLDGRASWVEGVGEKISPLRGFPSLSCVLVNPMVDVPTSAVFRGFADSGRSFSESIPRWHDGGQAGLLRFLKNTQNDLEDVALNIAPEIADVLSALSAEVGCELARMSGSGATCFGLFDNGAGAESAAANIKAAYPRWWIEPAVLGNAGDVKADKALDF